MAWKHDNVYIATSAYLPRYYPAPLLQFMQSYGQDKVLFGSNFPQLSLGRCISQVKELGLSAAVQAKFLQDNARRVFKL